MKNALSVTDSMLMCAMHTENSSNMRRLFPGHTSNMRVLECRRAHSQVQRPPLTHMLYCSIHHIGPENPQMHHKYNKAIFKQGHASCSCIDG